MKNGNGNVFVEITKDNMKKFERMAQHAKVDSVELINAAMKRWLAEYYEIGLTV